MRSTMASLALIPFVAVAATVSGGVSQAASAPLPGDCAVLVPTSDIHGHIESAVHDVGGTRLRQGGMLALDAYVSILRDKFGDAVVVLDSGDLFQGTLAANISRGRAMIDAFNQLGYRAATFGNHEFDYGPIRPEDADRTSNLKARVADAGFPFLSLNIYDRETHQRIDWPNTRPSMLLDVGGVRLGIIGVTTVETPLTTKANNVTELEFRAPAPLVIAEARRLRTRGAQVVVLLGHLGTGCRDLTDPDDPSSCDGEGELMRLLDDMPPATVDVAFGGHTHQLVAHWIRETLVVQAGAKAENLAWVKACPAPGGGLDRTRSALHAPRPMCIDAWTDNGRCNRRDDPTEVAAARFLGEPIAPSAALARVAQPYLDEVERIFNQRIGVVLPETLVRGQEADSLGHMIAESMRRWVDADFGLQNLGGVRADLPAGEVRFGSIYEVLPFDNTVSRLELTGAQVDKVVRILIGRRGKPPYLAGLTVTPDGESWRIRTANGAPLAEDRVYVLATNDFLVLGGESLDVVFAPLPEERRVITNTDMREALIELLRERYPERAAGGATTVSGAE